MDMDCYAPPPDHTCDIWQADDSIVPVDVIPPGDSRPYFCIKVLATFTTYSESEDGDTDVVESEERVKTFVVPLERLVGSDASWPAISDMLSAVSVPIGVQYNMIHEINEYLGSVACDWRNAVAKVVPMIVSISVEDYVEENSDENDSGDDYVVLRESMNEPVVAQVPASKAVVEGLETVSVSVEGGDLANEECAICQEKIVVGSTDQTIKRLPCAHVFHGSCIVRWLGVSCFCPLCRFLLPTL